MHRKIETIKDLQFAADLDTLVTIIQDQTKKAPENKIAQELSKAVIGVFMYTNSMQLDRWAYDEGLSDYKKQINALELEKRELEEEIKKLKSLLEFYEFDSKLKKNFDNNQFNQFNK